MLEDVKSRRQKRMKLRGYIADISDGNSDYDAIVEDVSLEGLCLSDLSNKFVVKNLLGEKVPRELTLKEGPKVKINDTIIEVTGCDKELVSQVAADIETLTKIRNKDKRIFQDGIYMTTKDGKEL